MALTEGERIILLAIFAVLMILVLFFELRVMRGKSKASRKMNARRDEAYNSILTCRSVINVLERQGSNVREARALVDKAKVAMQRGEHETAIDLCEKARDELTAARSQSPGAARKAREDRVDGGSVAEEVISAPVRRPFGEEVYSGSRLEVQGGPNYLVAKFELNTARDEISRAGRQGGDVSVASDTLQRAQAEFDSGNYQKALSLAVKAKKAASPQGADESIPLRRSQRTEAPSGDIDGEASEVVDVCPSCGSEICADDAFCGSCGKRREKERVCPSCGRVASDNDRFCRKCGNRVP